MRLSGVRLSKMCDEWRKLVCKRRDLQLKGTLDGGQSFRWQVVKEDDIETWTGVFGAKVWKLRQEDDYILYKVYEKEEQVKKSRLSEDAYENALKSYFRLDLDLQDYYKKWTDADENFKLAAKDFYGIRILNQDLTENIFSFICSSNNNIKRITGMVEKLATFYGKHICDIDNVPYYSFPTISDLDKENVQSTLRSNSFGYRAGYIAKTAEMIRQNGGDEWLEKLKSMDYDAAKQTLMTLTGIGAKVADCICLMSLGHLGAIPVDTHVFQIAANYYLPHLNKKGSNKKRQSMTDKIYNEIGDHFRMLYGSYAGWAHTVLFCADLKKFKTND